MYICFYPTLTTGLIYQDSQGQGDVQEFSGLYVLLFSQLFKYSPLLVKLLSLPAQGPFLYYRKNKNHQVATSSFSGTRYPPPPHLCPFSFLTSMDELFLVSSTSVSSDCLLYLIIFYFPRTFALFCVPCSPFLLS